MAFEDKLIVEVLIFAAGASRALNAVWEAVKSAVNFIIEWIKEMAKEMIGSIIESIKSLFNGMLQTYANFLKYLAMSIASSENKKSQDSVMKGVGQASLLLGDEENIVLPSFIEMITTAGFLILGTVLAASAVMLAIKAATVGLEAVVETVLFKVFQTAILSTLIGIVAKGLYENLYEISTNKEANMGDTVDFIAKYLGITAGFAGTIVEIMTLMLERLKGKSGLLFYLGLTLAISGYFLDASTTVVSLTGELLKIADWGGMIISALGLVLMISSLLEDKGPTPQKAVKELSALITFMEWVLGIGGLISSILTTTNDYNSNWSG